MSSTGEEVEGGLKVVLSTVTSKSAARKSELAGEVFEGERRGFM